MRKALFLCLCAYSFDFFLFICNLKALLSDNMGTETLALAERECVLCYHLGLRPE